MSLNLEANLRSSSLVLLRTSVFVLFHSTVTLIIDDLTYLNLLEGEFTTLLSFSFKGLDSDYFHHSLQK